MKEVILMMYENDNFIIYYNECDKKYLEKLSDILNQRISNILNFFKIDLSKKIIIKLYDNLEEYKSNITTSFKNAFVNGECNQEREFQYWMIANTEDGNINMQSLDLVKQLDNYADYTEEEFCYIAAHEFTHICQQIIGSNSPGWFWEVLATNLGNPECQHETTESFTLEDLNKNFDRIDGYGIAYKIGQYLFKNYDADFILQLANDNSKLESVMSDIIGDLNNSVIKK